MNTKGYIYIRRHKYYDGYNACKLGKTKNIPERDTQYATGEITRGYFEKVIELDVNIIGDIEVQLQLEFTCYNIKYDAGTEFYDKKIINLIEPILEELKIEYRVLNKIEIENLLRCIRKPKNEMKNEEEKNNSIILKKREENINEKIIKYIPRNDQSIIIEKSAKYFETNNKGMLLLMCGVGKTLISLWITEKLGSKKIVIGFPNILLLDQWKNNVSNIFPKKVILSVCGNIKEKVIEKFLKDNNDECVIITTYASSYKLYNVTKELNYKFDMKINDEVHHLTTDNMKNDEKKRAYINMMKIESNKQLSLTATLKLLENKDDRDSDIILSNDNIEHFGKIIDRKCLLQAINDENICDYVIQTIITDEEQLTTQLNKFNIENDTDKRLFLSAFASLKSISEGHSHHLLIYCNKKENTEKIEKYIKLLLDTNYFNFDIYYSGYHSEMKLGTQKKIIRKFKKSRYGILTCVYCLGEGWDFPILDGVVFSENMTSPIRILQSVLRSSRKNKNELTKKSKIILPILNRDNWLEDNNNDDFKKVKEVIYQMGLEDETVSQKIEVYKMDIKETEEETEEKLEEKTEEKTEEEKTEEKTEEENEEKLLECEELKKLILKTLKRNELMKISYEKAIKIIAEKNIRSKDEYYKLCDDDIRLTKEPEEVYKEKFTNWIEYLSIERKYYDLDTCKNKVKEYLLNKHIDFEFTNTTKLLKKLDDNFPPYDLWGDYYNINDLSEIIKINDEHKVTF